MGTGKRLIPLTAGELMSLHGLTVEQGLRQGYCIEGHVEEYRKAHCEALEQERRALHNPGYGYRERYKRKKEETIIKEEYTMDKNTKITLLLCLTESPMFAEMEQTEKARLLTELIYGEAPTPVAKRPGGRPKRATTPAEKTEGDAE